MTPPHRKHGVDNIIVLFPDYIPIVGRNLSYSAGSTAVSDFEEGIKSAISAGGQMRLMNLNGNDIKTLNRNDAKTEIFTNNERTKHLINFGDPCDYILSVSRADGEKLSGSDVRNHMKVRQGNNSYELRYYTAPGADATDMQKKEALKNANINIVPSAAYRAIPKSDTAQSMVIEFQTAMPVT